MNFSMPKRKGEPNNESALNEEEEYDEDGMPIGFKRPTTSRKKSASESTNNVDSDEKKKLHIPPKDMFTFCEVVFSYNQFYIAFLEASQKRPRLRSQAGSENRCGGFY